MNSKGLSCSICNLSFCECCLNSVGLDILIDTLGHKLSSTKYIIQRCTKCSNLIEDCLLLNMSYTYLWKLFKNESKDKNSICSNFTIGIKNNIVKRYFKSVIVNELLTLIFYY